MNKQKLNGWVTKPLLHLILSKVNFQDKVNCGYYNILKRNISYLGHQWSHKHLLIQSLTCLITFAFTFLVKATTIFQWARLSPHFKSFLNSPLSDRNQLAMLVKLFILAFCSVLYCYLLEVLIEIARCSESGQHQPGIFQQSDGHP